MTEKTCPPDDTDDEMRALPERFWTWDMKILLAINIVFLLFIIGGVIAVLSASSPAIYHYVLQAFS